eukprot:m.146798 g.146798  ORF g.146798 m.146798 type:complete len:60 (-) comp30499_c3_seq1:558-737(-)
MVMVSTVLARDDKSPLNVPPSPTSTTCHKAKHMRTSRSRTFLTISRAMQIRGPPTPPTL